MLNRRKLLKGVTASTATYLFAPLLKTFADQSAGTYQVPKRVIFVLFDNGFYESACQPVGIPLGGDQVRQVSLANHALPHDIQPFTAFKDRLTVVQGLRGSHLSPNHGGGFGALSGLSGGVGEDKFRRVVGESIDAAIARTVPSVFPILVLGIAAGRGEGPATALCSSAWGAGRPIAAQCRPELAYESLFGAIGADRNDFAIRRNLLDFVGEGTHRLRSQLAGPEREQLDYHLEAIESLSQRDGRLSQMQDTGTLRRHAPQLPATPPQRMTDILASQCDIAASALITGLTNVVTITSGLCRLGTSYSGISNTGTHSLGHNNFDPETNLAGRDVLSCYRRYLAEQVAGLLRKLQGVREGNGTMLDNSVLVFTSDSANRQHTSGENWPFVLIGNLGGRLKTNQMVSYPLRERGGDAGPWASHGSAPSSNPMINALYCTLLHAMGRPRETFNLAGSSRDDPAKYRALPELLM
jgi:hypothetical protein